MSKLPLKLSYLITLGVIIFERYSVGGVFRRAATVLCDVKVKAVRIQRSRRLTGQSKEKAVEFVTDQSFSSFKNIVGFCLFVFFFVLSVNKICCIVVPIVCICQRGILTYDIYILHSL